MYADLGFLRDEGFELNGADRVRTGTKKGSVWGGS
jgi:hypothetical protein